MINIFKTFFNDPKTFDQLVKQEQMGLRFVTLSFTLASLLIAYITIKFYGHVNSRNHHTLGMILVLNTIGFLIVAINAYKFANKISNTSSVALLDQIKNNFYKNLLLFSGIPYLILTFWILFSGDKKAFAECFFVFLMTVGFLYHDWNQYKKLKKVIIAQ